MIDKEKVLNLFAENLRMQRARKKYSQEFLAEKANITHQHFYRIENAKSSPTLSVIANIAVALDIKLDSLLPLDELLKYK